MTMALFLSLMLFSCGRKEDCLRNGDLIFVGIPVGYDVESGSMDEAISSATGEDGALNLIHMGIVEVQADSVWIIDATTTHGVARRPLDTFLKESMLSDGIYPEFVVKRVQGVDADAAVLVAKTPYWEKHFGQLGMEVPQGLPGTNPQKISQAPCLIEVSVESFFF